MEPLLIMIPGVIGGLILAFLVLRRRKPESTPDPFGGERLSTDVINVAHVRVAGVGGLGLVAMAVFVALYVPAIRVAIMLGLALGGVFAIGLIAWRRGGPMPSSGRRPGANTTLAIDDGIMPPLSDRETPPDRDVLAVPVRL